MKGKKLLAGIISAVMVLCTMALPAFAEEGKGTQTNPYTLDEFNALTDVSGQELWVNLGNLDISENSVTLGSYVMSDEYKWVDKNAEVPEGFTATTRENAQGTAVACRTNKTGATIHVSGTITAKDGAENINDHSNTKCLYFQIPETSTIILDGVTINGVFDLVGSYTYYYNMPDGSIAHQLTANKPSWATNIWYGFPFSINKIEINNSTINGCWFNNGRNFNNVSIYNTEFKSYENTVSANSSNPIWWQNIPGLESFTMTNSTLTSTRPIKFEGSSDPAFNVSFTGNTFTMEDGSKFTQKESDKTKNAAIYFGKNQNFGDVNISNNTISGDGHTQLVVISESADITKMSVADQKKISITNNKKTDGSALSVRESIGMWKSDINTPWDSALTEFLSNDNVELDVKWTTDIAISTLDELKAFRDSVNSGETYEGKTVTLESDINLSGISDWTPIGNGTRSGASCTGNAFKGTFDGGKHRISGLKITSGESNSAIGLFGVVDGGTVKNLILDDVSVSASNNKNAGAVIGLMVNGAIADYLTVNGTVTANDGVGGIVGRMTVSGTISNSVNNATVISSGTNGSAGGIVGKAYYTSKNKEMTISNCNNTGTITADYAAGGIVALSAANVIGCSNTAVITGGIEAGGIVGEQTNYGEISNNINTADISNNTGGTSYGGIVGWIRYQTSASNYANNEVISVTGNINEGNINASGATLGAGGIVGTAFNQVTVTRNTNKAASISSGVFASGIVGAIQENSENLAIDGGKYTITDNISTTVIENISANCRDLYVYNNLGEGSDKVIINNITWTTDTDSGYYMDGETKFGMMRFMFKAEPAGTVLASGIKYINASNLAADPTVAGAVNTAHNSSIFQGDVVKVPFGTSGTYYARAYITTENGTLWSAPVGCSVNWNQFFTDYTGGAQ